MPHHGKRNALASRLSLRQSPLRYAITHVRNRLQANQSTIMLTDIGDQDGHYRRKVIDLLPNQNDFLDAGQHPIKNTHASMSRDFVS